MNYGESIANYFAQGTVVKHIFVNKTKKNVFAESQCVSNRKETKKKEKKMSLKFCQIKYKETVHHVRSV